MESMQLHEDRIGGQHIFSGRVVNLKVDQIRLPNGHTSIREVIEHPGGVTVAALNERDELLMVRQFRYPFQNVLLELPAGKAGTRRNAFGRRPAGNSWRRPAPAPTPISLWAVPTPPPPTARSRFTSGPAGSPAPASSIWTRMSFWRWRPFPWSGRWSWYWTTKFPMPKPKSAF